jgi:hypothetical protein
MMLQDKHRGNDDRNQHRGQFHTGFQMLKV